ncbi:unnamed protein product [Ranitomeya imitator]|uniref:Uncharacterized protein n=1 Tax=Ranitomeya imitator TaxID=111125 RepID=A0ABN9MQ27_9NEOB|nr:unnamed protein product [Ranitomeya imitator]
MVAQSEPVCFSMASPADEAHLPAAEQHPPRKEGSARSSTKSGGLPTEKRSTARQRSVKDDLPKTAPPEPRRYPFSDEELNSWSKVPKVDAAVASTSKQSVLPVEDSGVLPDPLDRKAESLLKRSWEGCRCISRLPTFSGQVSWLSEHSPASTLVKELEGGRTDKTKALYESVPGCVMAGIDLKDAYYHLPIHTKHQRYLRVAVNLAGQVGPGLIYSIIECCISALKGNRSPQNRSQEYFATMFWKFDLNTSSHVDKLLEKEDVTLLELMDEDDLLQECKAQNQRLLDFLCQPQCMEQLVQLITQQPPDKMDEKVRFK